MRGTQSDPALRARAQADARAAHAHGRSTSLREIEERWEGDTSRSTAFYSARSSMLSSISSVVHAGEAL